MSDNIEFETCTTINYSSFICQLADLSLVTLLVQHLCDKVDRAAKSTVKNDGEIEKTTKSLYCRENLRE